MSVLTRSANELIERYLKIKVVGFEVRVPYFMNERRLRNTPLVYSGKADPNEIEAEANRVLERKRKEIVDEEDVVNLMTVFNLGVDCSGLVANVLAKEVKEKTGKDLFLMLKQPTWYRRLVGIVRPRTLVSADVLTGLDNAVEVTLGNIRPGDMIRRGKGHVMLIERVEDKGRVRIVRYIESNMRPLWGVQRNEIRVVDQSLPLEKQEWADQVGLRKYINSLPDAGLRRLKLLSMVDS